MKDPLRASLFGIGLTLLAVYAPAAAALEVGDAAPGFSLSGSDGKTHALEQHVGARGVVLAWFPKAFTPG